MRKFIAILGIATFAIPFAAFASPVSWDLTSGVLQPLQSAWSAVVKGDHFVATSTATASTFPLASTTALSVSALTSGNCVQAGTGGLLTTVSSPCGSGSGSGLATTAPWTVGNLAEVSDSGHVTSVATSSTGTAGTIAAFNSTGGMTFTGDAIMNHGLVVQGISTSALTNNGVIDYLNPNLRFSLPSTESYYWYNQGRGTNLLAYLNGSNGQLQLAQYGVGSAYFTGTGLLLNNATTSSSQASQAVWRDGNQNAYAQNFVSAATSFPTNGLTVTLTNASPRSWIFTGTQTQTMKLPSGTTLSAGATYTANNNSTGLITVVDNGSNTLAVIPSGGKVELVISDVSTANGSWDAHAFLGHGNVSGAGILGVGTSTPLGDLSVNGSAGGTNPIFILATSTSAFATSTALSVDANGNLSLLNHTSLTLSDATTTAANGINITNGCFAKNGTCLSLANFAGVLSILNGGTGETTASAAVSNLGAATTTDIQVFATAGSHTWTKPIGAKSVEIYVIGAGAGAGSGRKGAAASDRFGGQGGGGGGYSRQLLAASLLGATETVITGAKGTGGAAITTDDTDGNDGTDGGKSSFGSWAWADGGKKGLGGSSTPLGLGGKAGHGLLSGETFSRGGGSIEGEVENGNPQSDGSNVQTTSNNFLTGITAGGANGGNILADDVPLDGGVGGYGSWLADGVGKSGGTAGSTSVGGNGTAATANSPFGGGGGGGGGSSITTDAFAGGNGGLYGAGAGGGGASLNGASKNSGKGGDGSDGIVVVITYF